MKRSSSFDSSITGVLAILRAELPLILVAIAFSVCCAILYVINTPDVYRSQALVVATKGKDSDLNAILSKYSSIASFAGINLSSGNSKDGTQIALEFIKTFTFFKLFEEKNNILAPLTAANGWSKESGRLSFDESLFEPKTGKWVESDTAGITLKPSLQEAYIEFQKILRISRDSDTGIISISIEHYSPLLARDWVISVIDLINEHTKEQDVRYAQKSIAYLESQLAKNQIAELESGFANMIQAQTETIMLANANDEYLFKILDEPIASEKKFKPKRALIVSMSVVVGLILGVTIVFSRVLISEYRKV